ncbi:DUF732 domain-containing protein [Mycobacterium shinjukuense]|uniref:Uncharacterized protein n=1 Tax=Mycobacterium shinjukuense TaxID=398694 RepID=A0A7I7MNH1_9MYCO|nr:DUF732 domain-containing protein [Mycobacterium shinjukuense]MCV6984636.1 DUF732 domain-containing protein [Mycobacterium shinjukuense]ORB63564.1 hypothetical protein BST45_17400 [Mycobacterium shinjukuense]BBX73480.1 hypothetical protein MSHI_13860 [Mycobacterium shinjukuense]
MRTLVALLSAAAMIFLAVPAHAEPEGDDAAFLAALNRAGITYADPAQAIASAQALCALCARGETGLQLVSDLRTYNPGLSMDAAAQFAAIASAAYCPQHIEHHPK